MNRDETAHMIREAVADALNGHETFQSLVHREKARLEWERRWTAILDQVAGWALIGILGWLGKLAYDALGGQLLRRFAKWVAEIANATQS